MLMIRQLRMDPDDRRDADVGAHVGDPLEFDQQIRIGGVGIDVAFAGAHALQMVLFQNGGQLLDHLYQGLDPAGCVLVPLAEGLLRLVQHVDYGALQHRQLRQGRGGQNGAVLVQGRGMLGDIHAVVAQALKFRRDAVILIHDRHMALILQMRQKAHHIIIHLVAHAVDLDLIRQDLPVQLWIVLFQKPESLFNVGSGGAEDAEQQIVAALEGQGRRIVEDRVQGVGHRLELILRRRLVPDDPDAEPLENPQHREQRQGAAQVEHRVGVGDQAGVCDLLPQAVE